MSYTTRRNFAPISLSFRNRTRGRQTDDRRGDRNRRLSHCRCASLINAAKNKIKTLENLQRLAASLAQYFTVAADHAKIIRLFSCGVFCEGAASFCSVYFISFCMRERPKDTARTDSSLSVCLSACASVCSPACPLPQSYSTSVSLCHSRAMCEAARWIVLIPFRRLAKLPRRLRTSQIRFMNLSVWRCFFVYCCFCFCC